MGSKTFIQTIANTHLQRRLGWFLNQGRTVEMGVLALLVSLFLLYWSALGSEMTDEWGQDQGNLVEQSFWQQLRQLQHLLVSKTPLAAQVK